MMSITSMRFRVLAGTFATALLALAWTTSAQSGLITGLTGACSDPLSQPFLPWLDVGKYAFVADGGFESGARGWTLQGGAAVVSGNEPWRVHSALDSHSLYLPAGAEATSPAACIGLLHPTARFFARSLDGVLQVDASITVGLLKTRLPVGLVLPGAGFSPTLPLPLLANLLAPLAGTSGTVSLTFTAVGGPVWIDDVYIDPFKVN